MFDFKVEQLLDINDKHSATVAKLVVDEELSYKFGFMNGMILSAVNHFDHKEEERTQLNYTMIAEKNYCHEFVSTSSHKKVHWVDWVAVAKAEPLMKEKL